MTAELPVDDVLKTLSLDEYGALPEREAVHGGGFSRATESASSTSSDDSDDDSTEGACLDRSSPGDAVESDGELALKKRVSQEDETLSVPRTTHEVVYAELEPPQVPDPALVRPEYQLLRLGTLTAFVDGFVVVESEAELSSQVIASVGEESLLCFADRQPLGLVFEIFGAVHRPLYLIRVHPQDEALKSYLQIGRAVFYAAELCQPLKLESNAKRGCDACNEFGEEAGASEQEFSDDEEEAKARRRARRSQRALPVIRTNSQETFPRAPSHTGLRRGPWRRVSGTVTPAPHPATRSKKGEDGRSRRRPHQRPASEQLYRGRGHDHQGPAEGIDSGRRPNPTLTQRPLEDADHSRNEATKQSSC
jgi:H/ACA ribonucleoprotein complex non-core subunit NAF1